MIISEHISSSSAGTLNAAFWTSASEERYCWTANCHASELPWLGEKAVRLLTVSNFHPGMQHESVFRPQYCDSTRLCEIVPPTEAQRLYVK